MMVIPADLAAELYPMAWLLGHWHGYGTCVTADGEAATTHVQMSFEAGPTYLRQQVTVSTVAEKQVALDNELPGLIGAAQLTPVSVLRTWTAYWRPLQTSSDGLVTLEVAAADPRGLATLWMGRLKGPQVQLAADSIARFPDAPDLAGAAQFMGYVAGEVMWVQEIFSEDGQSRADLTGRMGRLEEDEVAAAETSAEGSAETMAEAVGKKGEAAQ